MPVIQKKYLLLVFSLVVASVLFMGWRWSWQVQQPKVLNSLPPPATSAGSSTSTPQVSSTNNTKTYTNTEFGFEFQYPVNWSLQENVFYSPYSKFNLMSWPTEEKLNSFDPPLLINVVTPDFVESGFHSLTSSDFTVAGVLGKEYEYTHDGLSEIDIVLPLKDNIVILGANSQYKTSFNQIISTLKFLK